MTEALNAGHLFILQSRMKQYWKAAEAVDVESPAELETKFKARKGKSEESRRWLQVGLEGPSPSRKEDWLFEQTLIAS
jgi:hypothetical protein